MESKVDTGVASIRALKPGQQLCAIEVEVVVSPEKPEIVCTDNRCNRPVPGSSLHLVQLHFHLSRGRICNKRAMAKCTRPEFSPTAHDCHNPCVSKKVSHRCSVDLHCAALSDKGGKVYSIEEEWA